jgi:hypothetical protein
MGAGPEAGGTAFSPASVAGLTGWWDFSTLGLSDGTAISAVADSSSAGHGLTQATGASQPIFKTAIQNGKAVGRFDGVNDLLATAAFAQPAAYSVFAVAKYTAGTLPQGILNTDDGGSLRHCQFRLNTGVLEFIAFSSGGAFTDTETATLAQFNCYSGVRDATPVVQTWVNGTSGGSTVITGTPVTPTISVVVGTTGGNAPRDASPLNGDIGEVLYYSAAVSTVDRQSIEAYLKAKWGTP